MSIMVLISGLIVCVFFDKQPALLVRNHMSNPYAKSAQRRFRRSKPSLTVGAACFLINS
jgi:hypothetical protein